MARLRRGGVGSNGATSTVGNRTAAGDVTATSTQPFPLSTPINTSPAGAPGGIFIQP